MERILSRHGNVSSAECGEIARAATRKQFFNVIIIDIDMPVMDGIEFLKSAVQENAHLRSNFIVCFGRPTQTVIDTTIENEVPLLKNRSTSKNFVNLSSRCSHPPRERGGITSKAPPGFKNAWVQAPSAANPWNFSAPLHTAQIRL